MIYKEGLELFKEREKGSIFYVVRWVKVRWWDLKWLVRVEWGFYEEGIIGRRLDLWGKSLG